MTLKEWKTSAHRNAWEEFLDTPAGQAGLVVLKAQAAPVLIPGEPLEQMAIRHAYLTGFDTCVKLLEQLYKAHTPTVQKHVLSEWDWANKTPASE